jgi:hypothetical protein
MYQFINNKSGRNIATLSLGSSILIHLLILFILIVLSRSEQDLLAGYAVISGIKGTISGSPGSKTNFSRSEELKKEKLTSQKSGQEIKTGSVNSNSNSETAGLDSLGLSHIYKESTLNVEMKYPVGWIYIDQQRNKKLDGITFWAVDDSYNPPPYVHVEVVEKYLFNAAKYKYTYKFKNFEGYYNEPEEMEGQVNQQIYIRTKVDEDFIIKLIINGRDNFNKFQPVFFAMVNSFQFGNSFIF